MAKDKQPKPPLHERLKQSGLSGAHISAELAKRGAFGPTGEPYGRSAALNWGKGESRYPIPESVQPLLEEILANIKGTKQMPEDHLKAAAKATNIHAVFRELRLALQFTGPEFAQALLPHLPAGQAPSAASIAYWETGMWEGRRSNLPSKHIFNGTDPITAYGGVCHDHGMGKWFDAHAEQFRQLLLEELSYRVSIGTGVPQWDRASIDSRPEFWDDYIAKRDAAAKDATPKR